MYKPNIREYVGIYGYPVSILFIFLIIMAIAWSGWRSLQAKEDFQRTKYGQYCYIESTGFADYSRCITPVDDK